jgi:hypothetical protein
VARNRRRNRNQSHRKKSHHHQTKVALALVAAAVDSLALDPLVLVAVGPDFSKPASDLGIVSLSCPGALWQFLPNCLPHVLRHLVSIDRPLLRTSCLFRFQELKPVSSDVGIVWLSCPGTIWQRLSSRVCLYTDQIEKKDLDEILDSNYLSAFRPRLD